MDPNCVDLESDYEVFVDIQTHDEDKTTVASCDPQQNHTRKIKRGGHPWVAIPYQKPRSFPKCITVASVNQTIAWDNSSWSTMIGAFNFESAQLGSPMSWTQVPNVRPGEVIIKKNSFKEERCCD